MLEFTISLNDSQMEFMPMRDKPDLARHSCGRRKTWNGG